jgi:hypothetical protein
MRSANDLQEIGKGMAPQAFCVQEQLFNGKPAISKGFFFRFIIVEGIFFATQWQ